jgi:hypothetical protein
MKHNNPTHNKGAQGSRMRRRFLRNTLALTSTLAGGAALAPSIHAAAPRRYAPATGDNAVLQWTQAALDAIVAARIGPPIAARVFAALYTAMFDAWSPYDGAAVGVRLTAMRRPTAERTPANKQQAISYAAYRVLSQLLGAQTAAFTSLLRSLGYDPQQSGTDAAQPWGMGNLAGQRTLQFLETDGANQQNGYADTSGYTPVNTPDTVSNPVRWQPLRYADGRVQQFLAPHWGTVKTFGLTSGAQYRPPAPQPANVDAYRIQAQAVVTLSAGLTEQQKMIAEYWAAGPGTVTPPGMWVQIAQTIARQRGYNLDACVTLYFILGNALLDASIACWEAKRFYDYVRPITAIRNLFAGQNIQAWGGPGRGSVSIKGETWQPYLATPPFSEHVSGHSSFSAAGAEILKRFTGSDTYNGAVTLAAGSSFIEPGATPAAPVTLSWPTFSAAADEAGMSRRYGGIHFEAGDLEGRSLGRKVATAVWNKAQAYLKPTQVTLQVTDGYDTKLQKKLSADGKVYMVTASDNQCWETEAGHTTIYQFQATVPNGATVRSATLHVEHYEEADITANAIRWEVGGGALTGPRVLGGFTPATLIDEAREARIAWDVTAWIDSTAKANDLKFIVRNNDPNGKKTKVDHITLVVIYT